MKNQVFYGKVEKSKLEIKDKQIYDNYLQSINNSFVKVDIRPIKKVRSTLQNSLYWVWVTILAGYIGLTKEEMHDTLKSLFNTEIKVYPIKETGEIHDIKVVRSTAKLNILTFCEYMNRIDQWAAELGVILPQPDNK
jgi:hypothetical protein